MIMLMIMLCLCCAYDYGRATTKISTHATGYQNPISIIRYRISLNRRRVLYENLSLLSASYSQGRLIVEGVLYKKYK